MSTRFGNQIAFAMLDVLAAWCVAARYDMRSIPALQSWVDGVAVDTHRGQRTRADLVQGRVTRLVEPPRTC